MSDPRVPPETGTPPPTVSPPKPSDARQGVMPPGSTDERVAQIKRRLAAHFTPRPDDVEWLLAALERAERERDRASYLAEHLFRMVDRDTWRDTGGDDGQGHYEGDYRAEGVLREIRALRALARATGGTNYTGSDPSVECGYGPCRNRLRRSEFPGPQFCSKEHRRRFMTERLGTDERAEA